MFSRRWFIEALGAVFLERIMNATAPQYSLYIYTFIALLFSWEVFLALSKYKAVSSRLKWFKRKVGIFMSYLIIASFGAILAMGYWWGMQKIFNQVAQVGQSQQSPIKEEAAKTEQPKQPATNKKGISLQDEIELKLIKGPTTRLKEEIKNIVIEARLTCDLKDRAEIPPTEVEFMSVGDAHAYIEGAGGKMPLDFVSPVRFRRQDDNNIVVINRFSLSTSSDLIGHPIESLKNFTVLSVPVITIVYGNSFSMMKLFEVSMSINGKDVWYYSYQINKPFQLGPLFKIPLEGLANKLDKG